MTDRITQTGLTRLVIEAARNNQNQVNKFSEQLSTGIKVALPSDSINSSKVDFYQQMLNRVDGYELRINEVQSFLDYQENIVSEANDTLVRATELAMQGANETYSSENRSQIAAEVWQLRDRLVQLANSKYLDRYIYNGANDNTPPFSAGTYAAPATGAESQRYTFSTATASTITKDVQISDGLTIRQDTDGGTVFSEAIYALERLGRSLSGYVTNPATGAPDGTGAAYTFPTDYATQTNDIKAAMDLVKDARVSDIAAEKTSIGGRLKRLETAKAIVGVAKTDADTVLAKEQGVDFAEAASRLTQAQTALQASYQVGVQLLGQSILDYI